MIHPTKNSECLVCYGNRTDLRSCNNPSCCFHMCNECLTSYNKKHCPHCKSPIPGFSPIHRVRAPAPTALESCFPICISSVIVGTYCVFSSKAIGWCILSTCCSPKQLGSCCGWTKSYTCAQILLGAVFQTTVLTTSAVRREQPSAN